MEWVGQSGSRSQALDALGGMLGRQFVGVEHSLEFSQERFELYPLVCF